MNLVLKFGNLGFFVNSADAKTGSNWLRFLQVQLL